MKDKAAYKTIGEVSKMFDIKPHVIRFWEENFVQLKPIKRKGRRRLYSENDISIIKEIKSLLYEEKYSISGAKDYLTNSKKANLKKNKDIILDKETLSKLIEIKTNLQRIKSLYEKKK